MTYQECYTKFVAAQKQLDRTCNQYGCNPTEENFQKALNAEEKSNALEDKLNELSNAK